MAEESVSDKKQESYHVLILGILSENIDVVCCIEVHLVGNRLNNPPGKIPENFAWSSSNLPGPPSKSGRWGVGFSWAGMGLARGAKVRRKPQPS